MCYKDYNTNQHTNNSRIEYDKCAVIPHFHGNLLYSATQRLGLSEGNAGIDCRINLRLLLSPIDCPLAW